jgi:hypothetical protein
MCKTTVVHVYHDFYDIYIGRKTAMFPTSKWACPYHIGKDGSRTEVMKKYEDYIRNNPILMSEITELQGKSLGCWCKSPDNPNRMCHGDILVKILNEIESKDK